MAKQRGDEHLQLTTHARKIEIILLCRVQMLQIRRIGRAVRHVQLRWWHAIVCGALYSLCFPPFNAALHPALFLCPLLGFVVLIPLFTAARAPTRKRVFILSYLFGIAASFGQYYWIGNVVAPGLWHLILIGLVLIALYVGLYYVAAAFVFRALVIYTPRHVWLFFPAFWVVMEWSRSLGELAFPWIFLGYSIAQFSPVAQWTAISGIYGLSFLVVCVNVGIWYAFGRRVPPAHSRGRAVTAVCIIVAAIAVWGGIRLLRHPVPAATSSGPRDTGSHGARICCIQPNFDMLAWGPGSMDSALVRLDSLISEARKSHPDCIVLPESALLCYTRFNTRVSRQVHAWTRRSRADILFGTLDFTEASDSSVYDYLVYNAAFFAPEAADTFTTYYKNILVPFSEALPFEGLFPIISRVNLGEADFAAGTRATVFTLSDRDIRLAPFICYEMIFPAYVRTSARRDIDYLVNITNDGWFGRTTAPFHHAHMARIRAIENGLPLIRCANSGISMLVDPLGRILHRTSLYTRAVFTREVARIDIPTIYRRLGDWPVYVSLGLLLGLTLYHMGIRLRRIWPLRDRDT
jgi:apolipoprotein N-acyltransferase